MKIRFGRLIRPLVIAFVAFGVVGLTPSASAAATDGLGQVESKPSYTQAKPLYPISTMAVGWHNEVAVARTIYQCPAFNCNQGQAYPGNDLAEVCTMSAGGVRWGLVFNRANRHTGFIPVNQLKYADPPTDCSIIGQRYTTFSMWLYQCPETFCNRGQANRSDNIRVICQFFKPGDHPWTWVYNPANSHEGFTPYYGLTSNTPEC